MQSILFLQMYFITKMGFLVQLRCNSIRNVHLTYYLLHKRNVGYINHKQMRGMYIYSRNEDLILLTKQISAYSNEGKLDLARKVFDEMAFWDCVACNVMIREYIWHGKTQDARELFDKMPERNTISWNSMIMAYASESRLHIALKLFLVMPDEEKDTFSWTTIISGLARVSRIIDSWQLFKQLPEPDSASWSSIISGFQQNGLSSESLMLFKEMLSVGRRPTVHSLTSALAAAADLAALSNGQQLYCHLLKRGFDNNNLVRNSAISMFMKSGCLHGAINIFNSIYQPDMFTWNAMISGYGQHGYAVEAILVFHQMQKAGFHPDRISFLGVLQGCSHRGFLKEGILYFDCMQKDFGVHRGPEHYVCMVDILARAGLLKEAAMIILKMPFEPTSIFWRTLLNGCRISGALKFGLYAADRVLELESNNAASCLMVMQMYAAVGRQREAALMRRWMTEKDARKELSNSWIEIKGKVHIFTTRDETHRDSQSIYMIVELLADVASEYA
ncbi:pentatricopeptide repeat-containing protein At4g02750-like [Phoenix dactylifera]|uniref:Pentatricopeptide repeat-containing protein At4g02750-like n=1 Tax=Phoenix dactylifera TaxID=42345 RepID=A0A8B9A3Z4_PHODC|nr:pentatricopeptide repeat-containing protein At4g02750-like [Phoenix dactylifera]XP_026663103.1 pentatricopeptide repeat-containing protein At4g02750-like [Phoenix dactylifera]XP_026663104.1 pentatricopeptide repeat-containing protein At4g02750-like [Phoenix dactylifera]XP_026663105.1 pentatricopeptide repeat-containing protein At4g02750-like [Phoenix dactylifera]XP_026663106.1 pentatricopeptide repeat-containing protein At4g02750-like [Phoenix dactylifera]XP_026663107.1 pentatricopeptide re